MTNEGETQDGAPRLFHSDRIDGVVLNWYGEPDEHLRFYAEAFHLAGSKLAALYGTTGAMRDFEACPVVYQYRHAFELYLKAIIVEGSRLLHLRRKGFERPTDLFRTHSLSDLRKGVERVIEGIGWDWDLGANGLRTHEDFVGLVNEFETVDKGSFAFRYPMDKSGKALLPDHFSFSLREFSARMDALLEVLDGAVFGLGVMCDEEEEMLTETQKLYGETE